MKYTKLIIQQFMKQNFLYQKIHKKISLLINTSGSTGSHKIRKNFL